MKVIVLLAVTLVVLTPQKTAKAAEVEFPATTVNGAAQEQQDDTNFLQTQTPVVVHTPVADQRTSVGLLFKNIGIDQGDTINSASLDLTIDPSITGATVNVIRAEDIDNPQDFAALPDVVGRTKTSAAIGWILVDPGDAITRVSSIDISNVITEVVSRPDWVRGNDILIEVRGDTTTNQYTIIADGSEELPALTVDCASCAVLAADVGESPLSTTMKNLIIAAVSVLVVIFIIFQLAVLKAQLVTVIVNSLIAGVTGLVIIAVLFALANSTS